MSRGYKSLIVAFVGRAETQWDTVLFSVFRRRRRSQNILDKRSSNTGGAGRCLRAVVCLFVVILFPPRSARVNMHVCVCACVHACIWQPLCLCSHICPYAYLQKKKKKKVCFASAGAVHTNVFKAHCNRASNRPS